MMASTVQMAGFRQCRGWSLCKGPGLSGRGKKKQHFCKQCGICTVLYNLRKAAGEFANMKEDAFSSPLQNFRTIKSVNQRP